ncbi:MULTISPECIES: lysine-2,3-aminomutase-like protein [unclassified Acidiphilium]|uniref:lysine-2,3-aminomutase-like protein n=1 Tax=unclassified Acidiphilium TaxID=2617493 RepID=UPI000BD38463|nr:MULTISPECIES: lysine-2,3-aminomutase-like protein [unclassified Acidiphilium]OYV55344.1 MAG: lysine 2,3-aminomutase [Acidiphilium sp. 20-67-58]OYV85102.1 MAG: lysine 2,3-aminomutase [Acidiphilium sp. 21-68-69]HQT60984.1 lysine-2,3-aminomutase-like protein [Acidiphilium sp.]
MATPTLRTADQLIEAGLAPPAARAGLEAVAARYATAIPAPLAALIGDPADPIGLQFIPDPAELDTAPHEQADPIGDDALSPVPGIVHRYPDRALLKPTLACPVYCRFCFRREHVGPEGGVLSEAELEAAFAWLEAHDGVREVILTGGDPLILSPRRLAAIFARLRAIPHISRLRLHTRVPVADPARITPALLAALDHDPPLFLVLHANHAREFGAEARAALRALRRAGIPLLGQSVLLRGVNDAAAALRALFETMLECGVKPYYLHQLDPAPGTARFHVPIAEGRALIAALRGTISGHALPTYILDAPTGKTTLEPSPVSLSAGL